MAAAGAALSDAARLQVFFEQNPVPLGVVSLATRRYLVCNAAAERLFGFGPGEMAGVDSGSIIDASAHDRLAAALASDSRDYEHVGTIPMRHRSGALLWCDAGFQIIEFNGEPAMLVTAADATPRIAAETALRQSELMFRRGFEHAKVPTLMLDADGVCTQANRACLDLFRVTEAALVGRPFLDLFEYDGAATRTRLARHLAARGDALPAEQLRIQRDDGSDAWVLASITHLDGDGPAARHLAEIVDQTELHLAIRALRESEERLAFALEATTEGVWDWDMASGRVVMNSRWSTMLGYAPGELEPHISTWEALAHPDDVPRAYAQLDAHAAGQLPQVEFEMRMKCKDGRWLWILNRAKIVARGPDGAPTRVVGTHSDIHARKEQREAQRRQADLLDSVLSNIPIAIDIIGADGQIEYVNAHAERLLGWSLQEMREQDVMAMIYPDPAYRAKVLASITDGSPDWRDWELRTRDGRLLTMSWANVRLPDGRVIGMGTDVTAQRANEAAKERLAQQMQQAQKLESLGLLAGGIAHDFNNLLVGVLGNASLAEDALPRHSEVRTLVVEIREAAARAADLTRQLLAYAGKGRFVVEPVDVSTLVGEMATLLRAAVSKRATLRQQLTPGLPGVEADATQLRQVVMNLITNASDALGDGEGVIALRSFVAFPTADELERVVGGTALAPGRYVCIEVEDTGAGMSAETLARIFDPFFTTKPTGHGLGLAATLGIVRSHRGAIAVQSAPGAGTRIRLYFPAVGTAPRNSPTPQVGAIAALRGSGDILLADDEPAVRDVARRALERVGFTVVACADGAEALEAFKADPARWTAVLLDLTMPVLGGQEALLAMRSIRPDLPAVLSSGYASEQLSQEVTALDHLAFVQKPFSVAGLVSAIFEVRAPD